MMPERTQRSPDWLDRLIELRVPARLAQEWDALAGAPLMLCEASGRAGRRFEGSARSVCLPPAGKERWPTCLPLPSEDHLPGRTPCGKGRGLHLAFPVVAKNETVGYLVSGELASDARLEMLEHFLRIMGEEMGRFLELGLAGPRHATEFPELVGASPPFQELRVTLRQAVTARYPVLIEGESGTGKDLLAWLLHHRGQRRSGPYVTLNCAALPDQLLESELFGHKRGAFTSADRDKPGLFGVAAGGTIFLDEIQQMSSAAQAKLLRAVETGEYMELGGVRPQRSDARVVVATNVDLDGLVASGRFRKDLFYRLSVLKIRMPPLREVRGDVPNLIGHFVRMICEREGLAPVTVSAQALGALVSAPWPGNVRQLIHELERAILRSGGREVRVEHLSPEVRAVAPEKAPFREMRERVAEAWEREEIRQGLERLEWNVSRLARDLGLSRRGLFGKMMRYGLHRPRGPTGAGSA